ncbi:MAG: hypothetical protein S4CHLAM123_11030 [Chlamydiales bacterium]|nr:hypothetical protein [Chlamydiales bacterium]
MRFFICFLFLWNFGWAALEISPEVLNESLNEHIHYSNEGPNYVGHIYIGGHDAQISQGTYIYVKNALESFEQDLKPIFVILELDTPGGQVFPAQKISDLLKDLDTHYGIPVVAYINNWAISAGAMLAYSCRYIATVKDGSMGAAQPVSQSGEATSEKVNSAIRTDFANRAAFFDRNPLIAEAMVDADEALVVRDGKIVELEDNEDIKSTDQVIVRKGKLLTLNSKEMLELGVADMRLFPEKLSPITAEEKEIGEWSADKELLFTHSFFKKIPNVVIKTYHMDWKTKFFSFISNPIVTSILFLGLMVGFYIEISTPGFGFAGGVGLFCLALILLSSFAVQAASWLEFILLGSGVALILLEIFVIPGFGITGILGIILVLAGLFAILLPGIGDVQFDFDTNTLNAAGEHLLHRLAWLSGAVVVGVIVIAILAKYIVPRFGMFSPLVLKGEQEATKGYVSGLKKEEQPAIGAIAIVVSPLRTAGKVEIEGKFFDAVSSGKFIDKGRKVKVIGIEGSKMIVEEEL